jgi:hypothetical protein
MIHVYPIQKNEGIQHVDADSWRLGFKQAAVASLNNVSTEAYQPKGPFSVEVTIRDGERIARKLANRWGFGHQGNRIFLHASDIQILYQDLIRLCYLTPLIEKIIPVGLFIYDLWGRMGLFWVRRGLKRGQ